MRIEKLFLSILLISFGCKSFENTNSKRPNNVPKDSFWIGGVDGGNWYFVKSVNNHRNMASIPVYNDQDGTLICDGNFMLVCEANKQTFIKELKEQIIAFDGTKIYFKQSDSINCYLQPVN